MSDALERVRRCLAASEERDYDHISVNVDESDLRAVCAELEQLREELASVRRLCQRDAEWRALVAPFAEFWRQWQRAPILKIDDEFYGIHVGTQFEASLRRSDFKRVSDFLDAVEAHDA